MKHSPCYDFKNHLKSFGLFCAIRPGRKRETTVFVEQPWLPLGLLIILGILLVRHTDRINTYFHIILNCNNVMNDI